MEACDVKYAIGREQGDGVLESSVDSKDLLELEDLLGNNGWHTLHVLYL